MQGKKGTRERSEAVTIRMTPDEKKNVYALAAAAGMTVTAYLIGCAIGDKLGQMVLDGFKEETGYSIQCVNDADKLMEMVMRDGFGK